ncbi:MAG: hypothetical protein DMF61_03920 [Blastocatellia bacterium AA13]|nr:MAG: hypothetical protein DMF61_03920 [Blastocatellia bacterium AA13]
MDFNRKNFLWATAAFALFFFSASSASAQISLGTAQSFGVLAGSAVTNTGATSVTGNLGVSPGTAVTGFPPGTVTGGTIHLNDAVASQAQSDVTTAYNAIAGTACTVDLTGQDLGGLTLTPGVYCFSSSAQLTGTLTLNALGNPNSLFIFKIGSTLTTASSSTVQVINPGSNCNVFWQVGSSATLGTGANFVGNILALTSITLTTGANVTGRVLARNGAVTMDTNHVTVCGPTSACPIITVNPATLPNGVVGTPYNQAVSGVGGTGPYTFTVSSGALPGGLTLNATTGVISGTPTAAGAFNFTITAIDANGCPGSRPYSIVITGAPQCPVIMVNPATLPPGIIGSSYSQTVSAVGGTAPYTFAISTGGLPPGLSITAANAGTVVVSGTPTASGLFSFTITATDANGCPGSRLYSIVIPVLSGGCPVITLSPATLPNAVLGTPYSQTILASGGTAPYTFAITSGALPIGLTLSTTGTTTVISGTPIVNGIFSFTITATDANGCPGSRAYSLQLPAGPSGPPGGAVPTLSEWGAILMALLIIAAGSFVLARYRKSAMSVAAGVPSTGFMRAEKAVDWKLLARTTIYVEAAIALPLIVLSANQVDILGALTSGLVLAFILHLLNGGARRR